MTKQKRIVITDKFIISREKPLSKFETIWDSKAQMKALHYKSGGKLVVKNPWALDDNDLDPYTYEYFVKDK